MKRLLLPSIVLLTFFAESIFSDNSPPVWFGMELAVVPRFLLIVILFIVIYHDSIKGIYYAIIFGLLYDVMYTDMIGVYLFTFALIAYLISQLMKYLHANLFVVFFVSLLGISSLEFLVYGLYWLIGLLDFQLDHLLYFRLLPTLTLNGLFILILFVPLRNLLVKMGTSQGQDD